MLAHGLQKIFTDVPLTVAGLLIFLAVHGSIVARVLFGSKVLFDAQANLPLEGEVGHD